MSSPKTAETSPSPAPSSVGGNNAPKFGTVIPNRVFVGGISSSTTEQDLQELFSQYGNVKATKIISDRAGVSKGYGFVTFETEDEARRLTQEADNIMLKDRKLNIAPAVKKQIEYTGFVKAYSPRLMDMTAANPGVVANQTVFFAHPAAAAYYNQQLLSAVAASNSAAAQQEYAAAQHAPSHAYLSHHTLQSQQAALQSQAAAAALAGAATNAGGGCSTPTQPQYVQSSPASVGSAAGGGNAGAPHFVYPPSAAAALYYPHYQQQLQAAAASQQHHQAFNQQVAAAAAAQQSAAAAAGWPAATAGQWRWLGHVPQQGYATAAAAASPQQGTGSVGYIAGDGLYAATQQSAPYILPDPTY